nr:hypothetical protein [Flavobacterium sp.]
MLKYKVLNETEQYSLQIYELHYKDTLPAEYWKGYEKFYPSLKNGDIGTIKFEFDHPNGFRLAVFKSDGFEDKYKVISKNALGNLKDLETTQPKIVWQKLTNITQNLEEELIGKIVANGNIIEFKLNQDQIILNKQNEFKYKIRLYPGRNAINYFISTDTKTAISDYFVIEHKSNIFEEVYQKLFDNNFLHFSDDLEEQKNEIYVVKSNLKDGHFNPPSSQIYFDIEIDYLVESGFRTYLIEISEGLKKLGCKAEVGNEYQSWNSEKTNDSKNNEQIHWIEFNGKKEVIWQGSQRDKMCYDIYFNKLIEIINSVLKESAKEERIHQITSYDGVFISLLTDNQYSVLKEICKPLKNKFINY